MSREQVLKVLFPIQGDDAGSCDDVEMGTNRQLSNVESNEDLRKDVNVDSTRKEEKSTTSSNRGSIFNDKACVDFPSERDKACVICLEDLEGRKSLSVSCQHKFHHDCLMEWMLKNHDDCPICRTLLWDERAYKKIEDDLRYGKQTAFRFFQRWISDEEAHERAMEQRRVATSSCCSPCRWQRPGGWTCICCVVNAVLFITGTGYLVASIVMAKRD